VGLALVLLFVGVKMVIAEWYKVPIGLSLAVIAVILAGSVAASLLWPKRVSSAPLEHPSDEPPGSDADRAARLP
jgi:tellurite resistance protein TerC